MSKSLKSNDAIKAVYEDKFQLFLQNIGVYENVISGTEKCKFCSKPITLDNIVSVFPESGTIKFVCDNPVCICKMNNYFNEKQ